jgi:hypothetical protein
MMNNTFRVLTSLEYDDLVHFKEDYPSGMYRTYFGLIFGHNAQIPDDTAINRSLAVTRLTNVRKADEDLHYSLFANQNSFIEYHSEPLFNALFLKLKNHKRGMSYDEYKIKYFLDPKHPKHKMRVKAYEELRDSAHLNLPKLKNVRGKVKINEDMGHGKYPRLVVDLTAPGSYDGGAAAEEIKSVMANFTELNIIFVKTPDIAKLREVFHNLRYSSEDYFYYFSDDCCGAIQCSDGRFMFNLDISKCDGSHDKCIFDLLLRLCSYDDDIYKEIKLAVGYLGLPLDLGRGDDRARLAPTRPVLYSGSTLTTIANNLAVLLICHSIKRLVNAHRSPIGQVLYKRSCKNLIHHAASLAGYIVTVDDCSDCPEKLQFLKHSPCFQGPTEIYLNLGVVLRSSGRCWQDLPGRNSTPLWVRGYRFSSSVIRGMVHAGDHSILTALRRKFALPLPPVYDHWLVENLSNDGSLPRRWIPNSTLALRYDCDEIDIQQLCDVIADYDPRELGCVFVNPTVAKIYKLDYSYDIYE